MFLRFPAMDGNRSGACADNALRKERFPGFQLQHLNIFVAGKRSQFRMFQLHIFSENKQIVRALFIEVGELWHMHSCRCCHALTIKEVPPIEFGCLQQSVRAW